MKKLRLLGALCISLFTVSYNACAEVVDADWKTPGDNLLTHDLATGLKWLDLTETNNLSRDVVVSQLVSGGALDEFRYATSAEVVQLWANFNIDLRAGQPTYTNGLDPNVQSAVSMLGNIFCEYDCISNPYGAIGVTSTASSEIGSYDELGAFQQDYTFEYTQYFIQGRSAAQSDSLAIYLGHYLVVTSVPIPPVIWLFCSGLLGLFGVARRKVSV